MRSIINLAAALAALWLALSTHALPSPPSLHPRSTAINTNNTADCTGCTNLGNFIHPLPTSPSDPIVRVRNGSYAGISLAPISANATLSRIGTAHEQHVFLGIPYAQQPVDSLRFRRPVGLNESWDGVRAAKRYSEHCFGVGVDNDYSPPYVTYKLGERCLTLNVVRPANAGAKLPVWVWIHGGGFGFGGSGDRRYNSSFVVDKAVQLGQPMIFVSLNYRTSVLGFPVGDEAREAGVQNLGLYDQRLALHWVRENIEAFGGDRERVTILGESAGGASMLLHLAAFGGRDDRLFRSVAVQSGYWGTQLATANNTATWNALWRSLAGHANCTGNSTLDCLRAVPLETIKQWSMANSAAYTKFNPVVDGELVSDDLQRAVLRGKFVHNVSVLLNNNLDEGISFGVRGVNNTRDIVRALAASQALPDGWLTADSRADLAAVYADNEDIYAPFQAGPGLLPPTNGVLGLNDRRSCAIFGDLRFVGPRRQAAQLLARSSSAAVYVSRFDQLKYKSTIANGAQHFQEVSSVFRNPLDTQNALGPRKKDVALADEMSSYWISFVASGDPNRAKDEGKLGGKAVHWPRYRPDGERQSVAWRRDGLGRQSAVVKDDYRRKGIELLMALRSGDYDHDKFKSASLSNKRDEL
ncbi:related to carboxylesterase/lipase EstA precursor [Sporisorium reilianum SRZ2]|uniref:Carboxylic ester hydrolase n=1 Tax=Sporisorium reilianum (strain SRZ2) TaxID=999809 RepID=E6ZPB0_SPORE|nr:related to carboxylesterase/lipase EstA precursor [Sporisorium reilianum SRZ2]